MKTLLTLLLIPFFPGFALAQDYQCLQAGAAHYFINGNRYLRGIRIDSVKTFADSTIYYPFHTPRGYIGTEGYWNNLDTNAGSWLGERVIKHNDGVFLFNNLWKDTVIIKSQATIGDSWIFYHDTTTRYYTAQMLTNDTMTVLGTLDSVKTIIITAYDATGIVVSDPVDSFQILLSKNNGFVKVFDLFTFPYHAPDSLYREGLDYFLDLINGSGRGPSRNSAIFSLVPFSNPSLVAVNDYSAGDVYEYSFYRSDIFGYIEYGGFIIDSIMSKTAISDSQVVYSVHTWTLQSANRIPPFTTVSFSSDSGSTFGSPLLNTSKMPEETGQQNIYYYYPGDSSSCFVSNRYSIISGIVFNTFEPCGTQEDYKIGDGNILNSICYNPPQDSYESQLYYSLKNGVACGNYVSVPDQISNVPYTKFSINISPNPAANELNIKTNIVGALTCTLFNILGQPLISLQTSGPAETINVRDVPNGIYFLQTTSENGNTQTTRISIIH